MSDTRTSKEKVCEDQVRLIYEHGHPRGIRDSHGFLLHFNRVPQFPNQEERYQRELAQRIRLAEFLLASLKSTLEPSAECAQCDELIGERDRAQDALQDTHIALGGDGEWVGRSPPRPAPDSGDLHLDVPELARERVAELKQLRAAQPPVPDARVELMEKALRKIARWHNEFPSTERTWDDGTPMSYAACFGSNDERDYMRQVALDALRAGPTKESDHG